LSRTISQLAAGTCVYVDETIDGAVVHTPYIYLGLDESGNARLLREKAATQKRMHSSNVASYSGCEADVWLENETDGFLSRFDAATINALVNTSIKYTDFTLNQEQTAQIVTIQRRCFLLSYTEEGLAATSAGDEGQSYLAALKTYTQQTSGDDARIGYNENDSAVYVWMRSGYSPTNFRNIGMNGSAGNGSASSAVSHIRPALSVAPATIVSDEGAEAIFLLPNGRRTTWDIEYSCSLGTYSAPPVKARLFFEHEYVHDFLEIKACNNYADAEPTWVEPINDSLVFRFGTNTTTGTYELGVKIHATGLTKDMCITEPIMIAEVDNSVAPAT